ncbi:MAG: PadR family transcriptional regulator [Anaerolineales bacterium]|nr:PadR family transcriptional regulator [Anaerolineales bacterium]
MSVRNAILGLLAQQPRHGYELHDAFEVMVGGKQNWDVKPAQVYTTLYRLEKSGHVEQQTVEQEGGPEKVIYRITEKGIDEYNTWLEEPVKTQHERDEFFLKLMLSLATEIGNPQKVLYIQRASLFQELHDLTSQRSESDPKSELANILHMDQAIMRVEADLRWLEMVEARLDEIVNQPIPEPEMRPRGRPRKDDE